MKKEIYTLLFIFVLSCSTATEHNPPKVIPDHTPYIAGLIEFSPDTTHHYPEIVVGYFTDVHETGDPSVKKKEAFDSYPTPKDIYTPILLKQVRSTGINFGLLFEPETKAVVSVRGPIGSAKEKKILFIHEGYGVYGDQNYALSRVPNGEYELRVILPDGRTFGALTHIPQAVNFSIPDSVGIPVRFESRRPSEIHIKKQEIIFPTPENSFLTVMQWNSSLDRELLLLKPNEHFLYTERSNYLRTGVGFGIYFTQQPQDTLTRPWSQQLDKPRDEIWMKQHYWLRFSFQSRGISKLYFPLLNIFASTKYFNGKILKPAADAAAFNDTTYLFDVTTINKINKNGEIVPSNREVFGFFSGYYSLYKQYTLYPIRNFDLDSVLVP